MLIHLAKESNYAALPIEEDAEIINAFPLKLWPFTLADFIRNMPLLTELVF